MNESIEERRRREAITARGEPICDECADCIEYYHLPDVMPGTLEQPPFPASERQGRKEPRIRTGPVTGKAEPEPEHDRPVRPHRQSPAASYGADGERLCGCGAKLRKRQRCCADCRLQRRKEAFRQNRSRERSPAAVDAGSDMPAIGPGTLSTHARSGEHS